MFKELWWGFYNIFTYRLLTNSVLGPKHWRCSRKRRRIVRTWHKNPKSINVISEIQERGDIFESKIDVCEGSSCVNSVSCVHLLLLGSLTVNAGTRPRSVYCSCYPFRYITDVGIEEISSYIKIWILSAKNDHLVTAWQAKDLFILSIIQLYGMPSNPTNDSIHHYIGKQHKYI